MAKLLYLAKRVRPDILTVVSILCGRVCVLYPTEYKMQLLDEIDTLSRIIQELAETADLIDVTDETITKEIEHEIVEKLDKAIDRISAAKELTR